MKIKAITAILVLALAGGCANKLPEGAGAGSASGAAGGAGASGGALAMGTGDVPGVNGVVFSSKGVGERVVFPVDSSALTEKAQAILDAQANWLLVRPASKVLVEGHADEQGTRAYNIGLGARRAETVRGYLVGKGIAANRIRTISYGKERPLAICSEERCWSQNRRAVTVVEGGFAS